MFVTILGQEFLEYSVKKWKEDNHNILLRTLVVDKRYTVLQAKLVACNELSAANTTFSINAISLQSIIEGGHPYTYHEGELIPACSRILQIWSIPSEGFIGNKFFMETKNSVYELIVISITTETV